MPKFRLTFSTDMANQTHVDAGADLNIEMKQFWAEASQKDVKETLGTQIAQANAIFDSVSDSVAHLNF